MSNNLEISPTVFTEFISEYEEGDYFTIPSRGISFVKNINKKITYVKEHDTVVFETVDDNKYDENAVRIYAISSTPKGKRKIDIGWIPSEINKNYRDEIDRGSKFYADISYVFKGEFDSNGNTKKSPGVRIDIFDFDDGKGEKPTIAEWFVPQEEDPPF